MANYLDYNGIKEFHQKITGAPTIDESEYIFGVKDNKLVRVPSDILDKTYIFDMSLITSSNANVGVQMGIQRTNGSFVNTSWNTQGEEGYSGTSVANYWTNDTTEHIYNTSVSKANLKDNIFYVNTYNNTANITSANINTTMPLVNIASCFNNCRNLTSIEGEGVCPMNMASTFNYCTNLTSLEPLTNWDTGNVTSMASTFYNCHNLTSLDGLANWNTGNVTSMVNTFSNCQNLTSLEPLTNWDTGNVTSMTYTFNYCQNLTSLEPLTNWDTGSVTNMAYTFSHCSNLTSLDGLANWNTGNVTSMAYTFQSCSNLTSLDGLANWDTGKMTSMYGAFSACSNLTSLEPLANWNVTKVTNMFQMFYNCHNAKTHGFNNWTGASASCANMFRYCNSLDDIQIHWNITCAANMFANRNTPLNVYASTTTNAYNQIYRAMGNATTNSSWNVTLYELES